jgi:hypothetical protein
MCFSTASRLLAPTQPGYDIEGLIRDAGTVEGPKPFKANRS